MSIRTELIVSMIIAALGVFLVTTVMSLMTPQSSTLGSEPGAVIAKAGDYTVTITGEGVPESFGLFAEFGPQGAARHKLCLKGSVKGVSTEMYCWCPCTIIVGSTTISCIDDTLTTGDDDDDATPDP